MNIEELKELEKKAHEDYEHVMQKIACDFALSNQKFKVGDIVDNNIDRILIDKVKVSGWSFDSPPCCVYYGQCYTKGNKPFKNGSRAGVRETEKLVLIK